MPSTSIILNGSNRNSIGVIHVYTRRNRIIKQTMHQMVWRIHPTNTIQQQHNDMLFMWREGG